MPRATAIQRCAWADGDPLMRAYHDDEWGVPQRDPRMLWEMLMLEGFQAGLAWITVLRKREAFRAAFAGFDPAKVARFGARDVTRLMADPGIIRARAKIEFDESVIPAQAVAQRIASTPHMMGSGMHYDGWLALKVPELKDESSGKKVKAALSKVEGVKSVVSYPDRHAIGVQFKSEGKTTTATLIEALSQAGFKAANM